METKKLTCWINWKEWKSVVDDAYNQDNNIEKYNQAFLKILAWETRDQSVPPAIACLKEILIAKTYEIDLENSSMPEIYRYQSTLAMNIVRFVNFITEPYQNKPKAIPIKTLATEIGIPDWIVNLRHNATHFSLPSIELLENAREYLYRWLKDNYVDLYTEIAFEESKTERIKEWIQNCFVDYMNERYQTVLMKSKHKPLKENNQSINEDIDLIVSQFKTETIEILIQDGFMIPTKDQLNALGIVPEEFIEEERIEIPKGFLNIWMEFLTYCGHKKRLLKVLFDKLVDTYRTESDNSIQSNLIREKFILSWIFSLIKLNSYKNEKFKFSIFEFEYDLKTVLLNVLKGKPGKYCLAFLHELGKLSFLNELIDADSFGKLIQLTFLIGQESLKTDDQVVSNDQSPTKMDTNDNYSIYSLEMFTTSRERSNDESHNFKMYRRNSRPQLNSDWKKIDVDWDHENLKLGLIQGQTYESLNLSMSQFLNKTEQTDTDNENDVSFDSQDQILRKPIVSNLFTVDHIEIKKLETLKKSLINNYWQL